MSSAASSSDGARLARERVDCRPIHPRGACGAVSHTERADFPVSWERADEMKHYALLRRGVVVQSVRDGYVDQAIGIQADKGRMSDVVGGMIEATPACARPERAAFGIVGSVRQALQHQKRMRRSSLPDVDLDRVVLPSAVRENAHEIDREAPEHTLIGEDAGDAYRRLLNVAAVGGVRRERATEIHLTRRAAQKLVMRRNDALSAKRVNAALHRGRTDGRAFDETFDHAPHRCELRRVAVPRLVAGLEAQP